MAKKGKVAERQVYVAEHASCDWNLSKLTQYDLFVSSSEYSSSI